MIAVAPIQCSGSYYGATVPLSARQFRTVLPCSVLPPTIGANAASLVGHTMHSIVGRIRTTAGGTYIFLPSV